MSKQEAIDRFAGKIDWNKKISLFQGDFNRDRHTPHLAESYLLSPRWIETREEAWRVATDTIIAKRILLGRTDDKPYLLGVRDVLYAGASLALDHGVRTNLGLIVENFPKFSPRSVRTYRTYDGSVYYDLAPEKQARIVLASFEVGKEPSDDEVMTVRGILGSEIANRLIERLRERAIDKGLMKISYK